MAASGGLPLPNPGPRMPSAPRAIPAAVVARVVGPIRKHPAKKHDHPLPPGQRQGKVAAAGGGHEDSAHGRRNDGRDDLQRRSLAEEGAVIDEGEGDDKDGDAEPHRFPARFPEIRAADAAGHIDGKADGRRNEGGKPPVDHIEMGHHGRDPQL